MDIHEAQSTHAERAKRAAAGLWPWDITAVGCPSSAKPPDAEQVVPAGQEATYSARRQPL